MARKINSVHHIDLSSHRVSWFFHGRQNFHYQKAVLEGPCELHFNKKIAFPNQSCAHAFVGGLCFCRTFESYKNQVPFCREHCFLVMQNHEHKSPHFVGDMLVK